MLFLFQPACFSSSGSDHFNIRKINSKFLDRGKGVPSFDEMMDIALVEVDFDDPTTNVRDVAP